MLRRLGVRPQGEQQDLALVQATEKALAETRIGIDRFFFDWFGGRQRGQTPESATYDRPEFADFKAAISAYAPRFETRSEEHTSELTSLMRNSSAVFCLEK